MRALDITNQLKLLLPKYTDYFHEEVDVISIVAVGNVATITTADPHYLETGDAIVSSGNLYKNTISGVVSYNGSTTDYLVTTEVDHDQTKASIETSKEVTLGGFTDDDWNGDVTLLQAGRNNFIVRFEEGASAPVLTGNEYLLEDRIDGVNGQHTITVVNSTKFTITTDNLIGGIYIGGKIATYVRVGVAFDLEQAADLYTKQETNDYWAYVVMGNPQASRDSSTLTEATNDLSVGSTIKINVIDGFEAIIFIPTADNKSAGTAIDIARFELQPIIHKCLLGVVFDTGLSQTERFKSSFVAAEAVGYNEAVLMYAYTYELIYLLTDDDAVDPDASRAFRDFDYTSYVRFDPDEDFTTYSGIPTVSGIYHNQDNIT